MTPAPPFSQWSVSCTWSAFYDNRCDH